MSARAPGVRHRLFVGKDVHKFSIAHMTVFPDGSKERLHGHNFRVSVGIDLLGDSPELLDFALVKQLIASQCEAWTERLLLPAAAPAFTVVRQDAQELEFRLCGQRYVVPAAEVVLLPVNNVVVESLAREFARAIADRLVALGPQLVAGFEVTVTESEGQGATYFWQRE